jgi:hypothetical protein
MGTSGKRLTDIRCRKAGVGVHGDGSGLALQVQSGARGLRRTWVFRYMIAGRARTMGLGSYPEVTLQRAREKAQECRRLKVEGIDPIENKHAARASLERAAAKPQVPTFDECAAACMAGRSQGWRSAQHGDAWERSLRTYVSPVFGHVPVDVVDMAMVCPGSGTPLAYEVRDRLSCARTDRADFGLRHRPWLEEWSKSCGLAQSP